MLEHNYLLPEGEDFDRGVPASAKGHSEGGQKSADEWEHEFYVVTSLAQLVDYADSWAFGDAQGKVTGSRTASGGGSRSHAPSHTGQSMAPMVNVQASDVMEACPAAGCPTTANPAPPACP